MFDQRSEGWQTPTRVSAGAWGTGHSWHEYLPESVAIEAQGVEDRETKDLKVLLDFPPAFSHEDIAKAYAEANLDLNAAAEMRTTRPPALRQPNVRTSGVQEGWKNLIAERNNNGCRRKPAVQPVVRSDDLLMEKYGRGVGELINRDPAKQSNCLLHNLRPPDSLSTPRLHHLENLIPHGIHGNNRSYGVTGMNKTKRKGWDGLDIEEVDTSASRQAVEERLLSMLGRRSELGMDVVRDDLDNYDGDMEKNPEILLQMASFTSQQAQKFGFPNNQDAWYFKDQNLDGSVHSSYQLPKSYVDKAPMQTATGYQKRHEGFWNKPNMVIKAGSMANSNMHQKSISDEIDQNTFKIIAHRDSDDTLVSTQPPPLRALWADVKPSITPLKQNLADVSIRGGSFEKTFERKNGMSQSNSSGDFDDYGRQRHYANEHWRTMDYYFKEAVAAYNRGERCRAATLSKKGKEQKQLAQEANERASQRIFQTKNKDIVNNITIDLHAQHVGEAINVLKRHFQTLCYIHSVHKLTVITGYGSHSINGRAKIKPAVTDFLARCGIRWDEINEGCLTITMADICNREMDISDNE